MAQSRTLTHDEIKASEAAFQGLPFNPKWSNSAKIVYDGIIQAMGHSPSAETEAIHRGQADETLVPSQEPAASQDSEFNQDEDSEESMLTLTTGSFPLTCRKDAIKSGIVKDATPAARRIGLEYPVGLTNSLWEQYVVVSEDLQDEHIQSRLQDMMVGVRLRLASIKEAVPFIDVPILLHFPHEPIPQLSLVFALFHRDPDEGQCLLLIHPSEIFSPRQNISHN